MCGKVLQKIGGVFEFCSIILDWFLFYDVLTQTSLTIIT